VTRYLLDADALIDYANQFEPTRLQLRQLIVQGDTLCVCAVSLAELWSGLEGPAMRLAEELLDSTEFLASSPAIGQQAGAWRYFYARRGITLRTTDVLVAATAHHYDATVITGNLRHYPMPELTLLPLPRP
jgi:predicted nucleic acid-binding protein